MNADTEVYVNISLLVRLFMRELRIGIQGKLMGIISLITLVALLIVAFTVMTLAEMDGDAVGVNISGRQRMLSQKMSKEALAISAGINEEANRASLGKTHALFQKSHSGLIKGDAALGLADRKSTRLNSSHIP